MISFLYSIKRKVYKLGLKYDFDLFATKLAKLCYCLPYLKKGIADTDEGQQLIVSLTTMPSRIDNTWLAIETILRQTYKPNKILLWLAEDEFGSLEELPKNLIRQQKRGLEIRFCKNLKPYNKIIYTLKECPDAIIVTVDDDILYSEKLLEELMISYKKNPKNISRTRSHKIEIGIAGRVLPYNLWTPYIKRNYIPIEPSFKNFFTGVGGVLYPPHCFGDQVLDIELLTKLSSLQDDIWLNVMARLNRTSIVNIRSDQGMLIEIPETQKDALKLINCAENRNDTYMKNVMKYFNMSGYDMVK